MTDPTGTARLRRSFMAEGNRRLARVRSLTHTVLVEHDMMAARNDPLMALFGQPGHRLATFTQWFERTVNEQLVNTPWWEKFLERAYESGAATGGELTRSPPRSYTPVPAVYRELVAREFAGIAAAMVQQVSRQAAVAAIGGRKPLPMYQRVLAVLRGVGQRRVKAAVNYTTVQLHNAARLAAFGAAGITQVALVPERLEPARLSRFRKHDHFVDATRQERAAIAARKAAEELFTKLRGEAEAEAAKAEVAAEQARAALEQQIAAELAGAPIISIGVAKAQAELAAAQTQAEAEVAAAKAATVAREAEAARAWEAVKAARRLEGIAAYEAQRVARAAGRAVAALLTAPRPEPLPPSEAAEVVAQIVLGAPSTEIPKRLLGIGSEYVNSQTAGDDRVCIICQDISADGPYTLAEAQGILPAHPNAVLEGSSVASYGAMREMVRAKFNGPAVYLRTGAKLLAVGPNHPIMTSRGWLRAREVREGDELLYDLRVDRASVVGSGRDLEQVPTVEDVFEAATLVTRGVSAGTAHDLHGDRTFCEGEVEVVWPARRLLPVFDSCGIEHPGKSLFEWSDVRAALVTRLRTQLAPLARILLTAPGLMGSDGLALALLCGHLRPLDALLLARRAADDVGARKNALDHAAARAELCRQREDARPGHISGHDWPFRWDRVLAAHVRQFSGWAFDATTATGLYNADGYLVHNCRCAWVPAFDMRFKVNRVLAGEEEVLATAEEE